MGCPFKANRVKFCPLCGGQQIYLVKSGCHFCPECGEFIEVCDYAKRIQQKANIPKEEILKQWISGRSACPTK